MPRRDAALEALWTAAPPATRRFEPEMVAGLPPAARRYLRYAVAPGTPIPSAVRLAMHGTIRLAGRWNRFTAEQVSRWGAGFVWRATAWVRGLPVSGFDRLLDGAGTLRWRIGGLIPVMSATGPEVTRSAAGRLNAEFLWLPTALLAPEVELLPGGEDRVEGIIRAHGEVTPFWIELDSRGRALAAGMIRWGNPDGAGYRDHPFGGIMEHERTFEGFTIPVAVRMGWYYGTDRFNANGEFFRATVASAAFR